MTTTAKAITNAEEMINRLKSEKFLEAVAILGRDNVVQYNGVFDEDSFKKDLNKLIDKTLGGIEE